MKNTFGKRIVSFAASALAVILALFLIWKITGKDLLDMDFLLNTKLGNQEENAIVYAMSVEPNLDPHWNASATGALILENIREGLYRVTETGIELAGAESVEINEDATVWTFKLRKDAFWNDGAPVTADQYVYSMQRLVDPAIATTFMRDYGQFCSTARRSPKER